MCRTQPGPSLPTMEPVISHSQTLQEVVTARPWQADLFIRRQISQTWALTFAGAAIGGGHIGDVGGVGLVDQQNVRYWRDVIQRVDGAKGLSCVPDPLAQRLRGIRGENGEKAREWGWVVQSTYPSPQGGRASPPPLSFIRSATRCRRCNRHHPPPPFTHSRRRSTRHLEPSPSLP